MSTKKRHMYDMAWLRLDALCGQYQRPVTAGEFAAHMGIARSTAVRWLREMFMYESVFTFKEVGKNGLEKTGYSTTSDVRTDVLNDERA